MKITTTLATPVSKTIADQAMDERLPSPHASALGARLARPVALVGMMGVGKTCLGRKLAAALHWPFIDADDEIEAAAQMSISEIFATYGEAYFRDGECRVISRLLNATSSPAQAAANHPERRVIATGGGAFCHPETRRLILDRAVTVWIDADLDTLVERTARKNHRPLLLDGDPRATLEALRTSRAPYYAEASIHVVSGDDPIAVTLNRMIEGIEFWLANHDSIAPPTET